MPRFFAPLLALILFTFSNASTAQQFASFRFLSEATPIATGSVTSLELSIDNSTLSFLNVAGLSTVFDLRLSQSSAIPDSTTVYLPASDFTGNSNSQLDLNNVQFFSGSLIQADDAAAAVPPHWFRLTRYNGSWSGVFRVAERIYTIERGSDNMVIQVRDSGMINTDFSTSRLVKVSALIDEDYIFNNRVFNNQDSHILALESIHILDGLLTDSLGLSLRLDQVIYRHSSELASNNNGDALSGATDWINRNAEAFGIDDNLATFAFRGDSISSDINEKVVLQGPGEHYQFATARHFGLLLGLPSDAGTLQATGNSGPFSNVHWNANQLAFFNNNPTPASLTQIVSNDEPQIEVTAPEPNEPIPDFLVDSESEESTPTNPGLQNDDSIADESNESGGNSGGGAFNIGSLVLLLMLTSGLHRSRIS